MISAAQNEPKGQVTSYLFDVCIFLPLVTRRKPNR